MHRKDLDVLLETVDVLRLVARQGRRETGELAWYLFVFGLYPALNIFGDLLGWGAYWVHSLFPAMWLATLPVAGPLVPAGVWGGLAGLTWVAWRLTHAQLAVVLVILAGVAVGQHLVYGYGIRRGRYRLERPLRISILPKIGWTWGVLMGGMALVLAVLHRGLDATSHVVLWGYAIGAGLFITGILAPGFFFLGLAGMLGVPLAALWHPRAAYALLGGLALAMALYGFFLYRRARQDAARLRRRAHEGGRDPRSA